MHLFSVQNTRGFCSDSLTWSGVTNEDWWLANISKVALLKQVKAHTLPLNEEVIGCP